MAGSNPSAGRVIQLLSPRPSRRVTAPCSACYSGLSSRVAFRIGERWINIAAAGAQPPAGCFLSVSSEKRAARQSTPRNHAYGVPTSGVTYGRERPPMPPTATGLLAVEHENTMLKLNLTKISCPPDALRASRGAPVSWSWCSSVSGGFFSTPWYTQKYKGVVHRAAYLKSRRL